MQHTMRTLLRMGKRIPIQCIKTCLQNICEDVKSFAGFHLILNIAFLKWAVLHQSLGGLCLNKTPLTTEL